MENEGWLKRQNDPNNWLVIPEFGVLPWDVDFKGFMYPVTGPNTTIYDYKYSIYDAIQVIRMRAMEIFSSQADLMRANIDFYEYTNKIKDGGIIDISSVSHKNIFAFHYCQFFEGARGSIFGLYENEKKDLIYLSHCMHHLVGIFSGGALGESIQRAIRTEIGVRGAQERWRIDPKTQAKASVYEHWKNWRARPNLYKSKAAFARIMMEKYEDLESQKVITDRWCKDWAEGKNIPTLPAE